MALTYEQTTNALISIARVKIYCTTVHRLRGWVFERIHVELLKVHFAETNVAQLPVGATPPSLLNYLCLTSQNFGPFTVLSEFGSGSHWKLGVAPFERRHKCLAGTNWTWKFAFTLIKQGRKRGVTINNSASLVNNTVANCSGAFINKPQTGKFAKSRRTHETQSPFCFSQCIPALMLFPAIKFARERFNKVGSNLFTVS